MRLPNEKEARKILQSAVQENQEVKGTEREGKRETAVITLKGSHSKIKRAMGVIKDRFPGAKVVEEEWKKIVVEYEGLDIDNTLELVRKVKIPLRLTGVRIKCQKKKM